MKSLSLLECRRVPGAGGQGWPGQWIRGAWPAARRPRRGPEAGEVPALADLDLHQAPGLQMVRGTPLTERLSWERPGRIRCRLRPEVRTVHPRPAERSAIPAGGRSWTRGRTRSVPVRVVRGNLRSLDVEGVPMRGLAGEPPRRTGIGPNRPRTADGDPACRTRPLRSRSVLTIPLLPSPDTWILTR